MGTINSNNKQLELLLSFICESVNSKIQINAKLLRDILDVVEGLMRGALNSKGNYNHSTLKLNCGYISEVALKLKTTTKPVEFLKLTHREHAIPLKVLVKELYSFNEIKTPDLKLFLDKKLISVLITKSEQKLLDSTEYQIKDKMPFDWNKEDVFVRFKIVQIAITKNSKDE